jgi:hypothetical protein
LRMAPQGSASTCTVRVTPLPFMKQTARHINMNTEWLGPLQRQFMKALWRKGGAHSGPLAAG